MAESPASGIAHRRKALPFGAAFCMRKIHDGRQDRGCGNMPDFARRQAFRVRLRHVRCRSLEAPPVHIDLDVLRAEKTAYFPQQAVSACQGEPSAGIFGVARRLLHLAESNDRKALWFRAVGMRVFILSGRKKFSSLPRAGGKHTYGSTAAAHSQFFRFGLSAAFFPARKRFRFAGEPFSRAGGEEGRIAAPLPPAWGLRRRKKQARRKTQTNMPKLFMT